jgi:hypothetical protein
VDEGERKAWYGKEEEEDEEDEYGYSAAAGLMRKYLSSKMHIVRLRRIYVIRR